jgi:hypothetical protein
MLEGISLMLMLVYLKKSMIFEFYKSLVYIYKFSTKAFQYGQRLKSFFSIPFWRQKVLVAPLDDVTLQERPTMYIS